MIVLLASLWFGAGALAAPQPEIEALARAPLSASARVDLARSLLGRPGWEEVGIEALVRLLDDAEVSGKARAILVDLIGKTDGRPGWAGVYSRLLESPDFPGRDLISLRHAEARLGDPRTGRTAVAELDRLLLSADASGARAIGRALLRAGEARRAQAAFERVVADPSARELELLSAIAAGDMARAGELARLGVRSPGAEAAITEPTRGRRAEALSAAGYVTMARVILEGGNAGEVGFQLAQLQRHQGQLAAATATLLQLRRANPTDDAARRELIAVYVQRHRYVDARKLCTEADAQWAAALDPRVAVERWRRGDRTERLHLIEEAGRVASDDPYILREWGKELIRAEKPEDDAAAVAHIERTLDLDPLDEDALGLSNILGGRTRTASRAAGRQLAAATLETSPARRRSRLAAAADLLVMDAEARKERGDAEGALDPYFVALLMDDPAPYEILGAGGLLWQAQYLDGALALFTEGQRQRPRDVGALLGRVRLLTQLGRDDEALAVLTASKSRDPQVTLLRRFVENGIRARDARAAHNAGDLETAVILWRQLAREVPDEPYFRHGLGDALAGLEEYAEAIVHYQAAVDGDPKDAWAVLGAANCMVALEKPEDARALVGQLYPEGVDAVADREMPKVLARAWRVTALREQGAGASLEAFAAWREALELDAEVFAISGLAALYLDHDQPEVALAFAEEAIALDPSLVEPFITRVRALEVMGRWEEARAAANVLQTAAASAETLATRREIVQRIAVQQSEYQRRIGDTAGAIVRLRETIANEGETADLWTALASASLDGRDCASALDAVSRALAANPKSRWALGTAVRAASVCKAAAAIHPALQDADRRAGGGFAAEELRASEFEMLVQRAEALDAVGELEEALVPMRFAEDLPKLTADEWARLGGAWLSLDAPAKAMGAFERTLAVDPVHVPAIIGMAGALRAQVRLPAAETHLQSAWERTRDPRVGLQLVQTMLLRGRYERAAETLAQVRGSTLPAGPPPLEPIRPDPLPTLALPSGRVPGPRTWPPTPPRDVQPRWLAEAVDAVDIELARERGLHVVAGGGVFQKPGDPGEQALDGWYVPVEVIFPPVGLLRLSMDAVVLHLDDGVDEALGVAPSLGIATPPFRRFFATARVGTSPLGFEKMNLLWHGHARFGVLPAVAVGIQTARTPVSDSLLSWAGKTETLGAGTQFFGFVSQLWAGAYASWTPRNLDLGLFVKGGYTEGWGIEPNPLVEGVAWGSFGLGSERASLRVGGQLVAMHHERQEDGFSIGEGGYFSPPVFVAAVAEVRGRADLVGRRGRLCASVAAGPQYMDGEPTPWFGEGVSGTARASAGVSWRLGPTWALGIDGRVQASLSEAHGQPKLWHQEAGLAHVTWGLVPQGPSAPSLTTLASAGAVLPSTGELCRAE